MYGYYVRDALMSILAVSWCVNDPLPLSFTLSPDLVPDLITICYNWYHGTWVILEDNDMAFWFYIATDSPQNKIFWWWGHREKFWVYSNNLIWNLDNITCQDISLGWINTPHFILCTCAWLHTFSFVLSYTINPLHKSVGKISF